MQPPNILARPGRHYVVLAFLGERDGMGRGRSGDMWAAKKAGRPRVSGPAGGRHGYERQVPLASQKNRAPRRLGDAAGHIPQGMRDIRHNAGGGRQRDPAQRQVRRLYRHGNGRPQGRVAAGAGLVQSAVLKGSGVDGAHIRALDGRRQRSVPDLQQDRHSLVPQVRLAVRPDMVVAQKDTVHEEGSGAGAGAPTRPCCLPFTDRRKSRHGKTARRTASPPSMGSRDTRAGEFAAPRRSVQMQARNRCGTCAPTAGTPW